MIRIAALALVLLSLGGCADTRALLYCVINDHDINRKCT